MYKTNYSERLVNMIHDHNGHEPGLFCALKDLVDEYHALHYRETRDAVKLGNIVDYRNGNLNRDDRIARYTPTMFTALLSMLGGYRDGWLHMITGDHGSGKTRLLLNLALATGHSYPVLYVSTTLDTMGIGKRMYSAIHAKTSTGSYLSNKNHFYAQQVTELFHPDAHLYQVFLLEHKQQDLDGLIEQIVRYHREENIRCVFIDAPEQLLASTPPALMPYRRAHLYRRLREVCCDYPISIIMARRSEPFDSVRRDQCPGIRTLENQGYMLDDVDVVLHYGDRLGAAWYDPIRQVTVLKHPRQLPHIYCYLYDDAARDYIRNLWQSDLPDDLATNNIYMEGMEVMYGFEFPPLPDDETPF
jgi:replicative DNA helicase